MRMRKEMGTQSIGNYLEVTFSTESGWSSSSHF